MAATNGDAYSNASSSSRQPHLIQGPNSGSTASNSSTSSIKTCFFMRDGDTYTQPKKFVVNPRYYPSIDCVQEELGIKMDMGVRTIFTPAGRHSIRSCDDLRQDGHYICSTRRLRAKGIDLQKLQNRPTWHGGGRASSGRRQYNAMLSYRNSNRFVNRVKAGSTSTYSSSPESKNSLMLGSPKTPKRILITQLGHADRCHQLLLNPKTQQTFEELLRDIGTMFDLRTPKLYTGEGKIIVSMSALLKGPDRLIVKEYGFKKKKDLTRTRGRWKVRIKTGYEDGCGTTAQVTLTVYGEKGNSGPIPLGYADGEDFHTNEVNEFEVSVGNIGEVFKIRIAHDNSGDDPSWFCEQVMMCDMHTDEFLEFNCFRWMARDHEDQDICRELPVIRDQLPVLPVVIYEVTVVTGDLWNAGTQANVYITLYGKFGDTGVRQLIDDEKSDKFMKGEVDVFHIEAVSLGPLNRVIIGHDGTGKGNGWYLDRVIIRSESNGTEEEFPCRRWLDDNEEDGKIVRELKLQTQRSDLIDKQLDDLEATATLTNDENEELMYKQRFEYQKWKFQPGAVIMLYSPLVQRPIRIRSDASIDARGEYKDDAALFHPVMRRGLVRVLQSVSNPMFHLGIDHGRIMGQSRGGGFGEFKVRVQDDCSMQFESTKHINNKLIIKDNGRPGDPVNANYTQSTFFVYVKGMFRDQGVILLCTSLTQAIDIEHDGSLNATGRRTHLAQFRVHKIETPEGGVRMFESIVFPKKFVCLREEQVDVQGKGDKLCQFRVHKIREKGCVSFESVVHRTKFLGMTPEGLIRPTLDSGGKNTRFYPEIIEYGIKKSVEREPTPPVQMKPKKHVKRRTKEEDEPPTKRSPPPYDDETVVSGIPSTVPGKPESALSDNEEGDWKVWIMTEEAAENAEVVMVAYGDRGNSGPIFLGSAGQQELFLSGNIDQFKVNLARIGKLYKIRMELHSSDGIVQPHWKLKEIKMKDLKTAETLRFRFNRYLSTREDDLDTCRELPAIRPRQEVLPVIKYAVHVITGREAAADTDANLYIQLFGERGDTGKRTLVQSQNNEKFMVGQEDTFVLEAVSLGKMTHCVIGHDGKDPGEGWFCEKVFVKETEDIIYYFPCNKWLDVGVGDKKIERCLKVKDDKDDSSEEAVVPKREEEPMVVEEVTDPDHSIYVTPGQGTQVPDELILHVYGSKGVSDPITLSNGDLMKKSNTIEFKQDIPNGLGELYKIRVGYEDVDMYINWYLQKMKIKNRVTSELLSFDAKHWLSKSEGDCDVWRELPVTTPGKEPLPVVTYVLEVYTGDEPGADTEANVYMHMTGKRGDTGKRFLYKSHNNDTKFQRGQMDIFKVQAVSLEDLDELVVGHDGVGKGAGWYLEKVIIKEELPSPTPPKHKAAPPAKTRAGNNPRNRRRTNYNNHNNLNTNNNNGNTNGPQEGRCWFFECNQWLDTGMGDGQLECKMKAEKVPKEEPQVIAVSDSDEVTDGHVSAADRAATATLHRPPSASIGESVEAPLTNGDISPSEMPTDAAVPAADSLYPPVANGEATSVSEGNVSPTEAETAAVLQATSEPEAAVEPETEPVSTITTKNASHREEREEKLMGAATDQPATAKELAAAGVLAMTLAVGSAKHRAGTEESIKVESPVVETDQIIAAPGSRKASLVPDSEFQGTREGTFVAEGSSRRGTLTMPEPVSRRNSQSMPGSDSPVTQEDTKVAGASSRRGTLIVPEPVSRRGSQSMPGSDSPVTQEDTKVAGASSRRGTLIVPEAVSRRDSQSMPGSDSPVTQEDTKVAGAGSRRGTLTVPEIDVPLTPKDTLAPEAVSRRGSQSIPGNDSPVTREDTAVAEAGSRRGTLTIPDTDYPEMQIDNPAGSPDIPANDSPATREGTPVAEATEKLRTPVPPQNSPTSVNGEGRRLSGRRSPRSASKRRKSSRVELSSAEEHALVTGTMTNAAENVNQSESRPQSVEEPVETSKSPLVPAETDEAVASERPVSTNSHTEVRRQSSTVGNDTTTEITEEEKVVQVIDSAIAVDSVAAAPEQTEPKSEEETTWAVSLLPDRLTRLPYEMTMFIIGDDKESPPIVFSDMKYTQKTHCYEFKHGLHNDLGEWFKIRLGHEDLDSAFDWHLEKVKMKNTENNELLSFMTNHQPCTEHCDNWRELSIIRPGKNPRPVIFYSIEVYTGSEPGADTEAEVYIQLFGKHGDSGVRKLTKSLNHAIRFQEDQMDCFKLQAVSLDDLERIVIGHDDPGRGAGWFLEKIIIKEEFPPEPEVEPQPPVKQKPERAGARGREIPPPKVRAKQPPSRKPVGRNQNFNNNKPEPRTWHFPCSMWLDAGMGDKRIERELYPEDAMDVSDDMEVVAMEPGPEWDISITTKRGTKNEVCMYVYGAKGKSGPHVLGTGAECEYFQSGSTDEFKQEISDVGEWYKIRIGHCDTDRTSGWLLDNIVMKNALKEEMHRFQVDRWMSRTEDDRDVWRELPVAIPGKKALPVVVYNVEVYTGKEPGSDTLASVFIELHGTRGDSGKRLLYESLTNFTKFRRSQMDLFQIEAVSLEDIKKIVIGHDEKMKGGGWYLDKIVVKEELPEEEEEDVESDEEPPPPPKKQKESKRAQPGPAQGKKPQDQGRKPAGRKSLNTNNNAGGRKQGRVWTFKCECWLDKGVDDGKILREFEPSHQEAAPPTPSPSPTPVDSPEPDWRVMVTTGKESDAMATTNEVSLYIYGDKGYDGPLPLGCHSDGDYFMKGATDTFCRDIKDDIGEWYKVRIGHNDLDPKSGWFLENMKIMNEKLEEQYTFKVKRWLSRSEDDHDVWRELPVIKPGKKPLPVVTYTIEVYTGDEPDAETEAEVYVQLWGSRGDSGRRVLYHSLNNDVKFQQGEMDMFQIEAVSLDEVEKIIVGHNETSNGGGWYLDHIIIKEELPPEQPPPTKKTRSKPSLAQSQEPPPAEKRSKTKSGPQPPPEGRARGKKAPRGANANNHNNQHSSASSSEEEMEEDVWHDDGTIEEVDEIESDDENVNNSNDEKKTEPRVWYVECKQWLDSGRSDGLIEREFVCGPEPKPDEEPDWNFMVTTGKDVEMATVNEVCVYVYGERGMAGPLVLGCGKNKEHFQEGQTDEFKRDLPDLGDLYKIRIGHDDTDPSCGWFLERVKMRHTKTDEQFIFKVKQWMSRFHDDCDIWRELPVLYPGKRPLPVVTYTIEVYTGDKPAADTEANVYIHMFGSRGDAGRRILFHSCNNETKFQQGQMDVFEIKAVSLEDIERIKIGHDGVGQGSGWYLDKVIIKEQVEGDGKTSGRPESARKGAKSSNNSNNNNSKKGSNASDSDGSDAEEAMEAEGSGDDNGGGNANNNNGKSAEDEEKCEPRMWYFVYDDWLEESIGEGLTECELCPTEPPEPEPEKEWTISLTTGKDANMSTTNEVSLFVYGEKGCCEPIILGSGKEGNCFQRAQTDEFMHDIPDDLGEWYKIRVGHNDEDRESGWFLERIKMKSRITEQQLTFKVKQWMSRAEADHDVWRELPVELPGKEPLPVVTYNIEVYTGSEPGSETDAEIYIQLIGSRGDTGKRVLYHSLNNDVKFQCSEMDLFQIQAVSLDDIEKILVGHNKEEEGDGWYVEKIIVREEGDGSSGDGKKKQDDNSNNSNNEVNDAASDAQDNNDAQVATSDVDDGENVNNSNNEKQKEKMWYFPCNAWLDAGKDDGKIEKEFGVTEPPEEEKQEEEEEKPQASPCKLWIKTAEDSSASKSSTVTLKAYGGDGESDDIELHRDGAFEPGNTDEFEVDLAGIGTVYKIRIGRQAEDDWENGWHLEEVKMEESETKEEFVFTFDRWMARDRDDCDIVRERMLVKDGEDPLPMQRYEVSVYTGDHWAACTDAAAFITLYGSKGDSGPRQLYKSLENTDKFCRGQVDKFIVEAVTLEELEKVILCHDGQGHGAGWFVDKVVVKELEGDRTNKQFVFPCNRWLDDHEGDKLTQRELKLQETIDADEEPKEKSAKESQGSWTVKVRTGDVDNAGTHAEVILSAYGTKQASGPTPLGEGGSACEDFEPGKEAECQVKLGDIGDLYKIRVEHDNSGDAPDWFLETITMVDNDTQEEHKLYFNRWLSEKQDDGSLCRELPVIRTDEPLLPVLRYQVVIVTADEEDAGTLADAMITLYGEHGDTGSRKLTESLTFDIPSCQGQADAYMIEAVKLGKISKVILEHKGENEEDAWLVERVVIKESEHAVTETAFPCNQRIEMKEGKAMVELTPTGDQFATELPPYKDGAGKPSEGTWTVWTTTGTEEEAKAKKDQEKMDTDGEEQVDADKEGAEKKDADEKKDEKDTETESEEQAVLKEVYLTVFGTKGQSEPIPLVQGQPESKPPGEEEEKESEVEEGKTDKNDKKGKSAKDSKKDKKAEEVKGKGKDQGKGGKDDKKGKSGKAGGKKEEEKEPERVEEPVEDEVKQHFLPGAKDEFKIKLDEIGEIYKIRIHFDKNLKNPDWFLKKLKLKDDVTGQEFHFHHNDWVKVTDENPDAAIEQAAIRPDIVPPEGQHYEFDVYTGDHLAAGTDADVHLTLVGSSGSSGLKPLDKSMNNKEKFCRNQMDTFKFETLNVGELKKIIIGHDGQGHGSGWFLEKVIVKEMEGPQVVKEYLFACGRWLDSHERDCVSERDLTLSEIVDSKKQEQTDEQAEEQGQEQAEEKKMSNGQWTVNVKTGDLPDCNTQAIVTLTVYGSEGQSELQHLENKDSDNEDFGVGAITEFKIDVGDVGEIYKIRIEHDNSGPAPAWFLEKIIMKDEATEEELKFYVNRWLADNKEDRQICRELAVNRPDKPVLPVLQYQVAVFTGSLDKAGTLAEPSIIIHGEHGDSGKRMLKQSRTFEMPFSIGQVDVFIIEAVSLGKLTKLLLEYNSDDEDDVWYIERVLIKEGEHAVIETVFDCNQWVKADETGLAKCELPATGKQFFSELPPYIDAQECPKTEGTWTIWMKTASEEEVQEKQDKEKQEKEEEEGQDSEESDKEKKNSENESKANEEDDKKNKDKKDEKEDAGNDEDGDKSEAELLKEVYLTIYGSKGCSDPIPLVQSQTEAADDAEKNEKDKADTKSDKTKEKGDPKAKTDGKKGKEADKKGKQEEKEKEADESEPAESTEEKKEYFKPGAIDEFKIKVEELGEIYKIGLHFDKNRVNPEWLLKKMKMKDDVTGQEFDFFYDDWIRVTDGNPDGAVELPAIRPDIQSVFEQKYLLTLVTGDLVRAETEAEVYCVLIGQFGDSGKKLLSKPVNSEKPYSSGQVDQFEVECLSVGKVEELVVGHMTDGRGRGWHLEYAAVRATLDADTEWIFPCHRWLDTGCEDRLLERRLHPNNEVDVAPPEPEEAETEKPESKGIFKCTVHLAKKMEMPKKDEESGEEKEDEMKDEDKDKKGKDEDSKNKKEDAKTDKDEKKGKSAGKEGKEKSDEEEKEKKEEDEDDMQIKCVQLMLSGNKGTTELLRLERSGAAAFTWGATEEFDIEALGIGALCKMRLVNTLNNATEVPAWTVKKVEIEDVDTKEKFAFDFSEFLGDSEVVHELPVMKPGQHIAPLINYSITIHGCKHEYEEEKADEKAKSKQKGADKQKPTKEDAKKGKEKGKKGKSEEEPAKKEEKKPIIMPSFSIKLIGSNGDSGIHKLVEGVMSDDNKPDMHSVTYSVAAVNLQELQKLTLAVDPQPGILLPWKLVKVEVKEGPYAPATYTFSHNEIIFTEEEDVTEDLELSLTSVKLSNEVAIPKEQVPTLPVTEGVWKVVATTGSDEDASATGQVHVVLCGEKVESEPLVLTTKPPTGEKDGKDGRSSSASKHDEKDDDDILKQGQEDEFEICTKEEIGDVFKVRLGFVDVSKDQKWFVEKLHFTDVHTHDDFTLEINDWLRVDDGKDGWMECPVIWPIIVVPKETIYEVKLYTGDVDNAGTDASVFINIFGEHGQSGKRHLRMNSTDSNKFEKGNVDVFEVAAVDLQNLTKVIMSHDGTGIGAGWFLDKVIIKDTAKPSKTYLFENNRWLDEGEDDGALERELLVKEQPPREGVWKVWITTGPVTEEANKDEDKKESSSQPGSAKKDDKDKKDEADDKDKDEKDKDKKEKEAKEDGDEQEEESKLPPPVSKQVVMVMYGSKGKSQPLPLISSEEKLYQEGATDLFEVVVPQDLGDIYKVRVGFSNEDGLDANQHWNLHKVKLLCEKTEKEYVFEFKDLLIKNEESDGWKECPVLTDVKEEVLSVITYHVWVHTSGKFGSGTDANVHIEIHGERGDTGSRKLLVSKKEGNKFENGKVDLFEVEAVDLDKPDKVIIGHDGAGAGSGWHLDKVIIKEALDAPQKFVFECDQWFDEGEDDGKIERDLEITKVIDIREPNWKVYVRTCDEDNSSTEANVRLTVFGDKGDTGPLPLGEADQGNFQSGANDEFEIYVDPDDVGKMKKIRIEHDNCQKADSAWRIDKIVLEHQDDGSRLEFPIDRWLSDHDDNGDVVLELPAKWPDEEPLPVTKYEVKISTGEASKADTDALIYITLHGKNGDSGKRYLYKNEADGDKWVKAQMDVFHLEAVDLADLEKVTVGYDQGEDDGWFLEKIEIKDEGNEEKKFNFTCNKWLDSTQDDNEIERELELDPAEGEGSGNDGPNDV